ETDCADVYAADARYANGTQNLGRITIATDNVFADNSAEEIAQQTLALSGDPAAGYAGSVTIAVDLTAERSAGGMMAPPDGAGPGGPPEGFGGNRPPQSRS